MSHPVPLCPLHSKAKGEFWLPRATPEWSQNSEFRMLETDAQGADIVDWHTNLPGLLAAWKAGVPLSRHPCAQRVKPLLNRTQRSHTVWGHAYEIYRLAAAWGGWRGGEGSREWLRHGYGVSFLGHKENVLEPARGDGCTTLRTYYNPLTRTLKWLNGEFYACGFYSNVKCEEAGKKN